MAVDWYLLRKDTARLSYNDGDYNNHNCCYYDSNTVGLTRPETVWRSGNIRYEMFRTPACVIILSPEMFRTLWSIFSEIMLLQTPPQCIMYRVGHWNGCLRTAPLKMRNVNTPY